MVWKNNAKIIFFLKKNPLFSITVGIIFFILIGLIYNFIHEPKSYEECYIKYLNNSKNSAVVKYTFAEVRELCREKFPAFVPMSIGFRISKDQSDFENST